MSESSKQGLMKRRGTVILAVVILIAGVAGRMFFAGMKAPPKENPGDPGIPVVSTIVVQNDTVAPNIAFSGRLVARNRIDVFPEVTGRLLAGQQAFREGNAFKKGAVLLQLDDADARYNLVASRSQYQALLTQLLADIKLDYPDALDRWQGYLNSFDATKALAPLPAVTDGKLKNFLVARNVFNQYYAIQAQEAQVRKYRILAPFDGVVSNANVSPGALLRAGQMVGNFIDPNAFELEVGLPIAQVEKLSTGQGVLLADINTGASYSGSLLRVSKRLDPTTQTMKAYFKVSGTGLYEGQYLEGATQGQDLLGAMTIPVNLLVNGNQVFSVVRDTLLQSVRVDVLHQAGDEAVVRGLQDGVQLLNQPLPGAVDGMRVKIKA